MQDSHGDFTVIQNLPPGVYYYRYIVDGKWQTDPGLPMVTDENGEVNNMIEIKHPKQDSSLLLSGNNGEPLHVVYPNGIYVLANTNTSPPGSYGQEVIIPSPPKIRTVPGSSAAQQLSQSPPSLPPHLLRALLNTAPPSEKDPSLLPLPHHVMLNHFYSLPREEDQVIILGVTQRYKSKFVTTVFYKPFVIDETNDSDMVQ
jgi:5'-AMP-activated protein kinase regulatory beta subunit